jgi:hypothetical protein
MHGQAGVRRGDWCGIAAARGLERAASHSRSFAEVLCQPSGVAPRRERAGDRARAAAASLQGRLGADSFQRAVQQAENDFAGQLQELLCGEDKSTQPPAQRSMQNASGVCWCSSWSTSRTSVCSPACCGGPCARTSQQCAATSGVVSSQACTGCECSVPHAEGRVASGFQSSSRRTQLRG